MREITETHIIELIKKYAKGGGGLLTYFKDTNIDFYVAINNDLIASRLSCVLEDVDGSGASGFRFRTNFGDALAVASGYRHFNELEEGDVISSGSTFSLFEMVIGGQSNMYPVRAIGQSDYGAYQIPPNSDVSSWADSSGNTRRGVGSLLILGSFVGREMGSNILSRITDSEADYAVPDDIAEDHDPDEVVSIADYLTRESRRLPSSNTSSFKTVTIGGTQYNIGANLPSTAGVRLWITDFTLTSNLTYIGESSGDPVLRASDNKLVSLEVYV